MFNNIFASFTEKTGNKGIGLFLPAVGIITSLAVLYVIDVWLLSPVAAVFAAAYKWLAGGLRGHPNYASAWWYFQHPLATARAWLGGHLSQPEVRSWWIGINVFIAVMWTLRRIAFRFDWAISNISNTTKIKIKKDDVTYGSARWAEKSDLARVCDFGFGPGITLGKYKGSPVRIPQKLKARHNKNVLVIGAPGCGKSFSYVRSNIFTAVRGGESLIVTDPKGELHGDMAPYLSNKGYNVKVLNLVRMRESYAKNFLDEIRTPLDADIFAQVVIATTEGGLKKRGDGFWDRAEQNLLKALALYVCYDEKGNRRNGNMGEIYDLIATGDKDAVNQRFSKLPPSHPAYGPYMISKMAGENMWGNIIIGLGTRLQTFQQEEVRRITETSEIDLNLPGKEKCAYFVITPDTHPAFNFLASLFFTFTFIRLIEQADANPKRRLDVPVKMLLDEFANIVSIADFEKKIATTRSRGIECHVIIQSLPQLLLVYGEKSMEAIRACCSTMVVLKVEDDYTADYMSRQLGKTTVEISNRSREIKPVIGPAIFDERENRGVTARLLMTPDEIIRMPASQCIVLLPTPDDKDRVPIRMHTLGYTEFPEAAELKKGSVTVNKEKEKEREASIVELNEGGNREEYQDTLGKQPVEDEGEDNATEENVQDGDEVIEIESTGSGKTVVPW